MISEEKPTLYIDWMSQPSRLLSIYCNMAKIPHKIQPTQLIKQDVKKPEYVKMNPMKTVPSMSHGKLAIGESLAIVRYLGKFAQKKSIYPFDDKILNPKIEQFFCYYHRKIRPIFRLAFGQVFAKFMGLEKFFNLEEDMKLVEKILDSLQKNYDLKNRRFLLGDQLTICDLIAVCEIMQLNLVPYPLEEKYPLIFNWLKRCNSTTPELLKGHYMLIKFMESRDIQSWLK